MLFPIVFVVLMLAASGPTPAHAGSPQDDLVFAAGNGDTAGIRAAVEEGADLDAPGDFGTRAIERALALGHVNVVEALLDLGASADFATIGGMRFVESVLYTEKPAETLAVVLEHADELNLRTKNSHGSAPLQTAIGTGRVELVELLLDSRHPIDLDDVGWGGSAIDAAVTQGDPKILRLILADERPYDINSEGGDGLPVLHRLAILGNVELLRIVLEHGRDLDLVARGHGMLVTDLTSDEEILDLLADAMQKQ